MVIGGLTAWVDALTVLFCIGLTVGIVVVLTILAFTVSKPKHIMNIKYNMNVDSC
jgi:hypothetical protein